MARWSATHKTLTPTATADNTNLVDSTYPLALQGGSSTQKLTVNDVVIGGQAPSTSSPTLMVFGRDSTVGATLSGDANLQMAALDPATAALAAPPVAFNIASTKPKRSTTLGQLLMASLNAYGGIFRWSVPNQEGIILLGNAASFGELSLSAFTGGTPGLISAGIMFESY